MTRARLAALALTLASLACDGRKPVGSTTRDAKHGRSGSALAVIDLSRGVPEVEATGLLGVGPRRAAFHALVDALSKIQSDKDVRGVFVRFGAVAFGHARAVEIGEALAAVRANHPVHCHAESLSNATLLAAARGCTRIVVSPAGDIESVGIAAQVVYMRKLLVDELHVQVDILQVGKSKGAAEPLTRDGPSDEARASLERTLGDVRGSWLEGIREGRGREDAVVAAEDGPHSPESAIARGLIDAVGYADEAHDEAKKAAGAVRDAVRFGLDAADGDEGLGELLRLFTGDGSDHAPVALINASGSISMGAGGGGAFGGSGGITERGLGRTLQRVLKDDAVKAIVLRIDSPGGSALASDMLWHELMKVRAKKPIVASVGEMAASGGYYLACAANEVFANATSIVGSIGVVGGKIGIGGALERFGVHAETFAANKGEPSAGRRAAYASPLTPWDDATRARVLERMTGVYDLFLRRVAEGRRMPFEKVAVSAEGQIFSGREGKDRGLVDTLGGLSAAIARARALANLAPDAEIAVVGPKPSILDALGAGGGDEDEGRALGLGAALLPQVAPEVLPQVSALVGLARGEAAVVAMPFAIVVR